jgi:hypothetical protein
MHKKYLDLSYTCKISWRLQTRGSPEPESLTCLLMQRLGTGKFVVSETRFVHHHHVIH